MRIMDVSIFLWCFLLMAGAFQASVPSIFGGENPISTTVPSLPNATEISNTFVPYNSTEANSIDPWYVVSYYQAMVIGTVQWVISAVNTMWTIFAPAINIGGWLQGMLPFLPAEFCGALTVITWIIYVAGIIQFITGRSFKMMR